MSEAEEAQIAKDTAETEKLRLEALRISRELERNEKSGSRSWFWTSIKVIAAGISFAALLAGYLEYIFLPASASLTAKAENAEYSRQQQQVEHQVVLARKDLLVEKIRLEAAQAKALYDSAQRELADAKKSNSDLVSQIEAMKVAAETPGAAPVPQETIAIQESAKKNVKAIETHLADSLDGQTRLSGLVEAIDQQESNPIVTGWIYVGYFPKSQWNYRTLSVDGPIQDGKNYEVIESVNVRDQSPKFTWTGYKFGNTVGYLNEGTRVKVLNYTKVGRDKIWAEVEAVQ